MTGFAFPGPKPRAKSGRPRTHSRRVVMAFSAVLTSLLFAMLHGEQTAFTWPVLALLFSVSLILTFVRIRLRSVAASALVHASYNLSVFLTAFIVTGGYRHLDRLPH